MFIEHTLSCPTNQMFSLKRYFAQSMHAILHKIWWIWEVCNCDHIVKIIFNTLTIHNKSPAFMWHISHSIWYAKRSHLILKRRHLTTITHKPPHPLKRVLSEGAAAACGFPTNTLGGTFSQPIAHYSIIQSDPTQLRTLTQLATSYLWCLWWRLVLSMFMSVYVCMSNPQSLERRLGLFAVFRTFREERAKPSVYTIIVWKHVSMTTTVVIVIYKIVFFKTSG